MCTILIQHYTSCPATHNTSRVIRQHQQAIYCADQRIVDEVVGGMCPDCLGKMRRRAETKVLKEEMRGVQRVRRMDGRKDSGVGLSPYLKVGFGEAGGAVIDGDVVGSLEMKRECDGRGVVDIETVGRRYGVSCNQTTA